MFYYLHIPRTAGRTFSLVAPQVLELVPCRYSECCRAQQEVINFVSQLDGQECNFLPYMGNYDLIYSFRRQPVVLTLLRNPTAWLLASVAKDLTSGTQITVQDLATLESECKANADHPACRNRAYPPKRSIMTERLGSGDLDLAKARLTAPEMAFFGLMEYFIESQCLLLYQFGLLTGSAAAKCSCQAIAQLRQARAGQPVVRAGPTPELPHLAAPLRLQPDRLQPHYCERHAVTEACHFPSISSLQQSVESSPRSFNVSAVRRTVSSTYYLDCWARRRCGGGSCRSIFKT